MTDLDARYGRTRSRSRRERLLAWIVGIGVLTTAVAWVWWVGTDPARTSIQARDLGFEIVDDTHVEVLFDVAVAPGTPVRCGVQALDASYSVVGWRVVDIPATEALGSTHRVELRTSARPTTGLVWECWLA